MECFLILAFDTTDRFTSLSWRSQEGVYGNRILDKGKATEILMPALSEILTEVGEKPQALAVVNGPGSFSGIRVGLATALGLVTALNISAYAFSRFQLMASLLSDGHLLMPAGSQHVLCQTVANGQLLDDPIMLSLTSLMDATNLVSHIPIDGLQTRVVEVLFSDVCLLLMASEIDASNYPLVPCYIRPADAIPGRSLIDKLLNTKP